MLPGKAAATMARRIRPIPKVVITVMVPREPEFNVLRPGRAATCAAPTGPYAASARSPDLLGQHLVHGHCQEDVAPAETDLVLVLAPDEGPVVHVLRKVRLENQ